MIGLIKLGGSLLHQPGWPQALFEWIQRRLDCRWLMVVGGGESIEAMRHLDLIHQLDPKAMHWRCIRMLSVNYEIALELWSRQLSLNAQQIAELGIDDLEKLRLWLSQRELQRVSSPRTAIIDLGKLYPLLYEHRPELPRLPENWNTTSDALALWMARALGATELVWLKSCEIDPAWDWKEMEAREIVDQATGSLLVPGLRCRFEKLQ